MKKLKSILAIMAVTVLLASCEKEGPQGPAGPQGSQGAQGNANVHAYTWTTTSSNWGWSSSEYWYNNLDIPPLTSDIHDYGAVMVYRKSGNNWIALPRSYNSGSTILQERFSYSTGFVETIMQYADGQPHSNPGSKTFKVVLISGARLAQNPDVNFEDYEEVKAAFNISD